MGPYKWVPVTTAWRVLRLRMEERPPMWRVAANILNKQSRTAEKGTRDLSLYSLNKGHDWSWVNSPNNLWFQLAGTEREISFRALSKIRPQTSLSHA
jgi:hypothetical protein